MSLPVPTNQRRRIESLLSAGKGQQRICFETGASIDYVQHIARLFAARPTPGLDMGCDHEKHLRLIGLANRGMGFPYCVKAPLAA